MLGEVERLWGMYRAREKKDGVREWKGERFSERKRNAKNK